MVRFFDSAPVVSWPSWLRRKFLPFISLQPSILPVSNSKLETHPTTVPYRVCSAANAAEYSAFLEAYYCPQGHDARLRLPPERLAAEFDANVLTGVEVRAPDGQLVGVVFSRYLGHIGSETTRLITWFCIAPEWRKKGLADYMLFAIYEASRPTNIFWFRNDGIARSIVPPVWTQQQITRTIQHRVKSVLQPESHDKFQAKCIQYWKQQHPTGICIDPTEVLPATEWYSIQTIFCGKQYSYAVLVANLYEEYGTDLACEVLYWFPIAQKAPEATERYILEELISRLPYSRIEAPASMPHLDTYWKSSLPTSWYAYGYDVGIPVIRPILSLTAS